MYHLDFDCTMVYVVGYWMRNFLAIRMARSYNGI